MIDQQYIRDCIFYKLYIITIYKLVTKLYPIEIENKENLFSGDKSCIYISRHTTHNWELLLGLLTLNQHSKKIIRGLGHYLIYTLCPWYLLLGVLVGTRNTANELIKNDEYIFVIPGGGEEMTFGCENKNKTFWKSKSKKYKMGFAKLASQHGIPVIPIHGENVENMVWAPFQLLANKIGLTRSYSIIMDQTKNIKVYQMLFFIKMFFTVIFCSILVIPVRTQIKLRIGNHIYRNEYETLEQYTKRCEHELNKLLKRCD